MADGIGNTGLDKPAPKDAIALLKADHAAVGQLFTAYEQTRSVQNRKALVAEICTNLNVQAQIKEEIFYPELKAVLREPLSLHEARAEHASVAQVISQLEGREPGEERYDAKVMALRACVRRHGTQGQSTLFDKAQSSSLDLDELGARMAARRDDLLAKAA